MIHCCIGAKAYPVHGCKMAHSDGQEGILTKHPRNSFATNILGYHIQYPLVHQLYIYSWHII